MALIAAAFCMCNWYVDGLETCTDGTGSVRGDWPQDLNPRVPGLTMRIFQRFAAVVRYRTAGPEG
jgi:hypothetical protein